ncbi:MAG: DUF1080 domain-containing protein [Bacteroidales bacterium]|jgi:hypothetical protein|nr:DUF1080 domain-containing protein [Bacteroidales bacterium]
MKKFFVLILCCACFSAVLTGQTKKAKGAQPLFTSNLSNADYDASVWSVDKSGVISATADQALWTNKEYENFELTLEFKTDKCTNSGVVIYATDKKDWIPNSVEIQIFDVYCVEHETKASTGTCGAVYGHLAPNAYQLVKKPGEWNTMKVTAKGKSIKVELNGKKITDMDMSKWTSGTVNPDGSAIPSWLPKPFSGIPTKGYIGFQGKHGQALIWFKNIKIKQL